MRLKLLFLPFLLSLFFLSISRINAQTTSGLVGYWSFDDSTANDNSGHGHNGTKHGSPATASGIQGNAMFFNGHGDYIDIPNSPALNFGSNGEMTISLWIKIDNGDSAYTKIRPVVGKSSGSSTESDYILLLEDFGGDPKLKWGTGDASDTAAWMLVKEPTHGTWHHVVLTMEHALIGRTDVYPKKVYIDCKLVKSDTAYTKADSQSVDLMLGGLYSLKTYQYEYYYGGIDELRIYNRALSDSEITDLCTIHSTTASSVLSGKVSQSTGSALANSTIYLVRFNPSDTSLTAIDTTLTDSLGNYSFSNIKDSFLYLVANPDSASYPYEIATYYDSASDFSGATGIHLHPGTTTVNFKTLHGSNAGGTGFIGGKITMCTLCKTGGGKPVAGLKVILTDMNGKVQAITYTNQQGDFTFGNISLQKYLIKVDKPYVDNATAPSVALTSSRQRLDKLEFVLHPTFLELSATTGSEEASQSDNTIKVFPNPANENVNITYDIAMKQSVTIQIVDVTGKIYLISNMSSLEAGIHSLSLNSAQLGMHPGIYTLRVSTGNQIFTKFFIIVK